MESQKDRYKNVESNLNLSEENIKRKKIKLSKTTKIIILVILTILSLAAIIGFVIIYIKKHN